MYRGESYHAAASPVSQAFVSHRRMRWKPGQPGSGEQPDVIAEEALSTRGRGAPLSLPFRHQQVTAGYFGVLAAVCETQATLEKGGREGTPGDTVLGWWSEEQHLSEPHRRQQTRRAVPLVTVFTAPDLDGNHN